MNAKLIIFAISLLCTVFAFSGVNFDGIIKKGHVWEARFLVIILILSISHLLTTCFYDILDLLNI